ncbi:MAG: SDR family oxidoreductase [Flavobacteriaceae bacterium]
MNKKIGVLGCGWLGLPLAKSLVKKGYVVYGTTTNSGKLTDLEKDGIIPILFRLHPEEIKEPALEFLNQLDILVINVPPGIRRDPGRRYFDEMKLLATHIKKNGVPNVLFVSSTSVYGNAEGEINEGTSLTPQTESAKQLAATERLFIEDKNLSTTIVRFGGLIGPRRHPVNQLAGKTDLRNGDDVVNLIHLSDCIQLLEAIIQNSWWDEIFNAVYPDHPRKEEYYKSEAIKRGLKAPTYKEVSGRKKGKIIKSRNFLNKGNRFYTSIHT